MNQTLRLASVLLTTFSGVSCGGTTPAPRNYTPSSSQSALKVEGDNLNSSVHAEESVDTRARNSATSDSVECCPINYGLTATINSLETDDGLIESIVEGGYSCADENSGAVVLFVDNVERDREVAQFGKHTYKLRFGKLEQGQHPWKVELRDSDSKQKKTLGGLLVKCSPSPIAMSADEGLAESKDKR